MLNDQNGYRVAFDVGGTFTDLVLERPDGELVTDKVLTTYPDPSDACLLGLDALMEKGGASWDQVTEAVHGTTLGSNVVIERKGTGVALITTDGFRDVLHLGRQKRYQIYDLQLEKPEPLLDRTMVFTVPERVLADGSVHRKLDEEATRTVARELVRRNVTSVAVCLLHSYANPDHERRVGEILAEESPSIVVSLSSDVSPKFREFERTSTTVANAYLMSNMRSYLYTMISALRDRGFGGELFIMQSSGGLASAAAMTRYPVRMIESGPAAGALIAARFGALANQHRVVAFDMGGTTAKLAVAIDGEPAMVSQFELHKIGNASGSGIPMNVRSLDLAEIGSGGGSIARTKLGTIAVGPDSAGSQPGPACYGQGGTDATVTDANLVLGYLNPENFAAGSIRLDVDAAADAIMRNIGVPLGLSLAEAAWGIHRMVNLSMELTTRVVSIERGHDPRDLALVATGGSGPVHACRLAQALGLPLVILPTGAGVASALGMLAADIKVDADQTSLSGFRPDELAEVESMLAELMSFVVDQVQSATDKPPTRLIREVEMRYRGQGFELAVELPEGPLSDPEWLVELRARFEKEYGRRYGYASTGAPLEATTWKVTGLGERRPLVIPKRSAAATASATPVLRAAYFPEFGDYVDTATYRRDQLHAGDRVEGPAIVEDDGSTSVIPPNCSASVDIYGNLVVSV